MKKIYLLGWYLLISACILIQCSQPKPSAVSLIQTDLAYLAADELEGREFGTSGERKAASYIASAFQELGLQPAGSSNFYQYFRVKQSSNPHERPSMDAGDTLGTEGLNVLAMIDNPGDNIIVIGAHFDHLGFGGPSSRERGATEIHNGADDNASGTAALIHLARMLREKNLYHDILFFAISGEEKGLWGSNYFVKNPTIDLSKVNYMINMDMVGRLDTAKGLVVHGTGTSPFWPDAIDKANIEGLKIIKKESGTGPSDHTSFYLQDLPVLHFFTGQHEDYHKPSDDADKINYEGILSVVNMIVHIIEQTDKTDKLAFTKTKDESSDSPRFTVSMGVMPDYTYEGRGMRIDGVTDGKPAAIAGLSKGDVVVQLGDSAVIDMMSYMRALSAFQKGDQTTIIIFRNGKSISKEVKF